VWSKYKVTADKGINGDSRWCCVNLSHDAQVVRVVEFNTAVCLSLCGVGLQTNRIRIELHCLYVFMNCINLVTI
jgi:hypothetical protein